MKTVTCDICKKQITVNSTRDTEFQGHLYPEGAASTCFPVLFKLVVERYQFNTTDFDVCAPCLLEAAIRGLKEQLDKAKAQAECLKCGYEP